MAGERQLPGLGLTGFWDEGSDGWKAGMDENLRLLSVVGDATVLSRSTALPESPVNGVVYIEPDTDRIAARDNGEWVYIDPWVGLSVFVHDESLFVRYGGDGWVPVESGIGDAPEDGEQYARKNGEWVTVEATGGNGDGGASFPEAPTDGRPYVRQAGGWEPTNDPIKVDSTGAHRFWRILVTAVGTANEPCLIAELDFYTLDGTLRKDGTPLESGSVGGSAGRAFNGNYTSSSNFAQWYSSGSPTNSTVYLGMEFEDAIKVARVDITDQPGANNDRVVTAFTVQASDDGEAWEDVWSETSDGRTGDTSTRRFDKPDTGRLATLIPEAPDDGLRYVRQNGEWVPVERPPVREQLTAARTWYVDPGGDDTNDGLSAETPFATINQAFWAALMVDAKGNALTIQVADGEYDSVSVDKPTFDGTAITVVGNDNNPEAVVIGDGNGPGARFAAAGLSVYMRGVLFQGSVGLWARYGALVFLRGSVAFGACSARAIGADNASYIECIANVTFTQSSNRALYSNANGNVYFAGCTVTFGDGIGFGAGFAFAELGGLMTVFNNNYTGAPIGPKYVARLNGVIQTNGEGADNFPGSSAGSVSNGGQAA